MTTSGIEAVYVTTHNWGKAAKFFQNLGFALEFDTGHASGQLRAADGPYLFVAEVPETEAPAVQLVLRVPDTTPPGPPVEAVTGFETTHFGTTEMTVRDPDGREWTLQAPSGNQ